jgi:hypothetical protein
VSRTASDHGTEDAGTYYLEHNGPDEAIRSEIDAMRGGSSAMPDEALINAMGRAWVMKQATGQALDVTDEAWDRLGLPWCATYNEAYLATLERLTEPR